MNRQDRIARADELVGQIQDSPVLWPEFKLNVWALKAIGDDWVYVKSLEVQDCVQQIEKRMPHISDKEMDEYCFLMELWAVLAVPL